MSVAEEPLIYTGERALVGLAEIVDDFMTDYSTDSLRALPREGCCFDYLMTILVYLQLYELTGVKLFVVCVQVSGYVL